MYDMVEMRERGRRIEKYLANRFSDDAKVLVVSSGDFIHRSLLPCLMRLPDQVIDIATGFSCHNCSIAHIELHPDGIHSTCLKVNDTAHLYVDEDAIPSLKI